MAIETARITTLRSLLDEHLRVIRELEHSLGMLERVADRMCASLRQGGTVFWLGNGGSAADSQHLAAEFVGRFRANRPAMRSVALTTDTSILTAVANDYGFECVFARQLEALCRSGDVVVGISTSGESPSVVSAVARAREMGAFTFAMTGGHGGQAAKLAHESLIVPSVETARIQEAHILAGHMLCEWVENELYGSEG